MVETASSCCNDFDTFPSSCAPTMLERGARVVQLFIRPTNNNDNVEESRPDCRETQVSNTFELPLRLPSMLTRSSLPNLKESPKLVDSYDSFRFVSESSSSVTDNDEKSSHDCMFPPTEYTSCSSGAIADPAELKLQEFAQELARLKAERRCAVQKQVPSEPNLNIVSHRAAFKPAVSSIPCDTDVHKAEETCILSTRSSEENLTYLDASSEALDYDSGDTTRDESRGTADAGSQKCMDFSLMHSVYQTKGTHEEAFLVRMKYAEDAGGCLEQAEHAEQPKTIDSAMSILRQESKRESPSGSLNADLVKECASMLRDTLRMCTSASSERECKEIHRWSPTPTTQSVSTSAIADNPQAAMPQEPYSESESHFQTSAGSPTLSSSFKLSPKSSSSTQSQTPIPTTPRSHQSSRQSNSEPVLLPPSVLTCSTSSWSLPPPPFHSTASLPLTDESGSSVRYSVPTAHHMPQPNAPVLKSSSPHRGTSTAQESSKFDSEYPASESFYATDEDDGSWSQQPSSQNNNSSESILASLPITIDGRVVYPEAAFGGDASFSDYADSSVSKSTPYYGLCEKLRAFAEDCGLHFIEGKEPVDKNSSNFLRDSEGTCTSDELNTALLARLACVQCGSICGPPVTFCPWGHAVCERCRPASLLEDETCSCRARCPYCSSEMQRKPCPLWSYIARSLMYPCRFRVHGCTETSGLSYEEKTAHEAICPYRQHRCWADGCDWQGVWHHLRDHLLQIHEAEIIRAEWYRFVDVKRPRCIRSATIILLPPNELVQLHSHSVVAEHRYLLQHLSAQGPDCAAVLPRFRLRIASPDGKSEIEVRGEAVDERYDVDTALRSGKCFRVCAKPFRLSPPGSPTAKNLPPNSVQLCLEKGRPSVLR